MLQALLCVSSLRVVLSTLCRHMKDAHDELVALDTFLYSEVQLAQNLYCAQSLLLKIGEHYYYLQRAHFM